MLALKDRNNVMISSNRLKRRHGVWVGSCVGHIGCGVWKEFLFV